MRGRPRLHSSTSWFLIPCVQHISWCWDTVPAVGLSQVALKTEVTVTPVSIRHRGPRPEWCISAWREGEKELGPWRWWGGLLGALRVGPAPLWLFALVLSCQQVLGKGLLYECRSRVSSRVPCLSGRRKYSPSFLGVCPSDGGHFCHRPSLFPLLSPSPLLPPVSLPDLGN